MRKILFTILSLMAAHSFADSGELQYIKPPEELPRKYIEGFYQNLNRQSQKLQAQPARTCEASYQHIFDKDEVKFSLFYGYLDADEVSMDGSLSQVMMEHLQLPCGPNRPNIEACGFQLVKSDKGYYQMKKQMKVGKKDKTISLEIMAPSVSWDNRANSNVQNLYFDQKKKSNQTEDAFYQSLKESDVVFYDGHSRIGAGPGFHPRAPLQIAWDKLTKDRTKKFVNTIGQSENLKMVGLFACETEKYYEGEILKAAPQLGLISTTEAVFTVSNEESVLGSLNSILARKCKSEFAESTIPEKAPEQDYVRVKNFFEYSRSPSKPVADSYQNLKVTKANGMH